MHPLVEGGGERLTKPSKEPPSFSSLAIFRHTPTIQTYLLITKSSIHKAVEGIGLGDWVKFSLFLAVKQTSIALAHSGERGKGLFVPFTNNTSGPRIS